MPFVSLITRRSAGYRLSFRRRRRFRLAPAQALLAMAAGSVALWLLRSRHLRASAFALPPPGTVFRPVVLTADADDEGSTGPGARGALESHDGRGEPILAHTVWAVPRYSTALPLPWVHRAEVAIRLGRADELRGVAAEMLRAGQDIEAGLLDNYALLLERSRSSRERVLAEVTRLLRAATVHRRGAPPEPRRAPSSPPVSVLEGRASFIPPPPPAAPVEPRRASSGAPSERPVVPMPVLSIGEKRHASR